jgi:hypothetical protein
MGQAHLLDEATLRRLQALLGEQDVWEAATLSETSHSPQQKSPPIDKAACESSRRAPDVDEIGGTPLRTRSETETADTIKAAPKYQILETAPQAELDVSNSQTFPEYGLRLGEMSPEMMTFCPWQLTMAYPFIFIGNTNRGRCSPFFLKETLLNTQSWDFFYIWPTGGQSPLLLIPTEQFQHRLDIVNVTLGTRLTVPSGKNSERFRFIFGQFGTPRPRFLGRINDVATYDSKKSAVPSPEACDNVGRMPGQASIIFNENIEAIKRALRGSRPTSKKAYKAHQRRLETHLAWGRSTKRVQRYLGLRKRISDHQSRSGDSTDDTTQHILNLEAPVPYDNEGNVIFIALDVEVFELHHNTVTEIGLAMLDTRDIMGVPPGKNLLAWFDFIDARHIRIKENLACVNRRYVVGCEDFFDFGSVVSINAHSRELSLH